MTKAKTVTMYILEVIDFLLVYLNFTSALKAHYSLKDMSTNCKTKTVTKLSQKKLFCQLLNAMKQLWKAYQGFKEQLANSEFDSILISSTKPYSVQNFLMP